MGEVWRARLRGEEGFEKRVAVKRISVEGELDSSELELFEAEMNLCAKLQHRNIIQVFCNGLSDGSIYLVMEYLDGKNLSEVRRAVEKSGKSSWFGEASCCYIVSQVAKGLAYAHRFRDPLTKESMEIVHRDISPQNIMVTYDGSVKIIDFGIAKFLGRRQITSPGGIRGKPSYMSPEQVRGEKLGFQSDLFSLGAVFFELLTGHALFRAQTIEESLRWVETKEIQPPSRFNQEITNTLDFAVLKMLSRRPSERYTSAREIAEVLDRYLHGKHPLFTENNFFDFVKEYI